GEFGGRDADALEAVGDDAVGGGQQGDEQIHGGDLAAVVFAGAGHGFTEQADDVVGEELAVEGENGLLLPLLLVEQLLKLAEQSVEIGAEPLAPEADAWIRPGE